LRTFQVDISYEIDFVGCPGSRIEGVGGTTAGTIRMETRAPAAHSPTLSVTGPWLLAASSAWVVYKRRAPV
jgi:hypothetical protein